MADSKLTRILLFLVLALVAAALLIAASAAAVRFLRPLFNGADPKAIMVFGMVVTAVVLHLARRYGWKLDNPWWTASLVFAAVPAAMWTGPLWHPHVPSEIRFETWMLTDFPEVMAAWAALCLLVFLSATGRPRYGHGH